MQHLIRADYIAQSVERGFNLLIRTINFLWVAGLFTLILSYYYPDKLAPIFELAKPLLKAGYRVWIPFIFAPFYMPIVRGLVVSAIESIRKSRLQGTAFDTLAQAQVVRKKYVIGGGSESDWTDFYLHISHPITGRRFSYKVSEAAYKAYNKGDLVRVRHNPENASVLFMESF